MRRQRRRPPPSPTPRRRKGRRLRYGLRPPLRRRPFLRRIDLQTKPHYHQPLEETISASTTRGTSPKGFRTKTITLVTTLLDDSIYSLPEIAALYQRRWEIETNFGHVKTTMKMDVLKCRTVDGVLRELHVFGMIYNLVRQVMVEAALRQHVAVNRISFIDALRWLQSAQPGDDLSGLVVVPERPDRYEPRVRKRRPKKYKLMTKPRKQLKQELARA